MRPASCAVPIRAGNARDIDVRSSESVRAELLRQLDEVRRTVPDAGAVAETLPGVTRARGRAGDWHQIAYSALTEESADGVIAREIEHYRALGVEVEWTAYSHDAPADLLARLERHGFRIGPPEVVMVLDLQRLPEWATEPPPLRVERVESAELLAEFQRVAEAVFGASREPIVAELARGLRDGSRENIGYVAFDAELPVGVGRLSTTAASPFGGLYGGGTLASHRGRGFYRATVAARARDAAALGARYLRVDALPTSQPILERLGFERLTETWPCALAAE